MTDGSPVLHWGEPGAGLHTEQDALDAVGATYGSDARVVAIPVTAFAPSFFDLRTRQAGLFVQKLANYRLVLAVVGDVSEHVARSESFAGLVSESRAGGALWFVADTTALDARVASLG